MISYGFFSIKNRIYPVPRRTYSYQRFTGKDLLRAAGKCDACGDSIPATFSKQFRQTPLQFQYVLRPPCNHFIYRLFFRRHCFLSDIGYISFETIFRYADVFGKIGRSACLRSFAPQINTGICFQCLPPPHIGLSLFCQINETHPSALPELQRSSAAFWGQNIAYKV